MRKKSPQASCNGKMRNVMMVMMKDVKNWIVYRPATNATAPARRAAKPETVV